MGAPESSPEVSKARLLPPGIFELLSLESRLKSYLESLECQDLAARYLLVRKDGAELQGRVKNVTLDPAGEISFTLEENSANGCASCVEDSFFVQGGYLNGSAKILRIGFSFCQPKGDSKEEMNLSAAHLHAGWDEGVGERWHYTIDNPTMVLGLSINPLKENGLVILKEGKLNPALLAPEARRLFKDYTF